MFKHGRKKNYSSTLGKSAKINNAAQMAAAGYSDTKEAGPQSTRLINSMRRRAQKAPRARCGTGIVKDIAEAHK